MPTLQSICFPGVLCSEPTVVGSKGSRCSIEILGSCSITTETLGSHPFPWLRLCNEGSALGDGARRYKGQGWAWAPILWESIEKGEGMVAQERQGKSLLASGGWGGGEVTSEEGGVKSGVAIKVSKATLNKEMALPL